MDTTRRPMFAHLNRLEQAAVAVAAAATIFFGLFGVPLGDVVLYAL